MKLPIYYENCEWMNRVSFIPTWTYAVSFGLWVFCKGQMSNLTKNHEFVHYRQQVELLFVFQWILYGLFYTFNLIKYRNKFKAYWNVPFERSARRYANQLFARRP